MKINQDLRLNNEKLRLDQKQAVTSGVKFQEIVKKQDEKLQIGQLQNLLKDIESAGERLARSRTFKDLAKYKGLVKQFVKEAVDFGMELKQSNSWNRFGQGKSLSIVETVDQKLVELTEGVLDKEQKSIDLLGKMGEIKGLLINIYT